MKLINIENAKSGDVLGQSIFGYDGRILLRDGIKLNQRYINKLVDIGVAYIYIQDSMLEDIKPEDPKFLEIKSQAIRSLSRMFSKLQYNDTLEIKSTLSSITDIVDYLIENKEINSMYLIELKTFDNYTYVHSLNTCILSLVYGIKLSYSKPMLIDLGAGTLLHDIGKMKIPQEILNKNGKLTVAEYDLIKTHPEIGYEMVKDLKDFNERGKRIILEHHERYDGKGYPYGLKGDEISKFARIACISDIYDAIASDRVYRKKFSANEAYEFILGGCGTYFDIELVKVFKDIFSIYPLGACVKLSNGMEGFVIAHNKGFPDRPIVRVLSDIYGNNVSPVEINLIQKTDVCIEGIVL